MPPTATKPNTTPARVETNINDLRHLLEKYKSQIEMALPKHVTAERMIRVALTAFSRTPLLAKCSATSICGALVQASILGLEPDGLSGECFLIPYWNSKVRGYECQMQAGYRGIVKLARNTGEFALIDAQPVHDNDHFDFQKGSETYWVHKWDPRAKRGEIFGYWAGYVLKDGGRNFEFMSVGEIEAHRDQYSQGAYKRDKGEFVLDKDGNKILIGPWADSPDWMFRKTPLMRVLKLAPKSYQLRQAMQLTEAVDIGQAQSFVDLPKELNPVTDDDLDEPTIPEPKAKSDAAEPTKAPESNGVILISDVQVKRLEQICEESGWRQKDFLAFLKQKYAIASAIDIRQVDFERITEIVRAGGEAGGD